MANWTPNTWKNDEAPKINADNMNHLNDGISEALDTANTASDTANTVSTNLEEFSKVHQEWPTLTNIVDNWQTKIEHAGPICVLHLDFDINLNGYEEKVIYTFPNKKYLPTTYICQWTVARNLTDDGTARVQVNISNGKIKISTVGGLDKTCKLNVKAAVPYLTNTWK